MSELAIFSQDVMSWKIVAKSSEVPEGEVIEVFAGGEPIALYNLDGQFYATHNICTHAQGYLSEGFVDGDHIECPLHQGLFHIPTGKAMQGPVTEDIRIYPVRVEGEDVLVEISD